MIYKRCPHKGRDRDRCPDPWYGTYQLRGQSRVRVSLAKWTGHDVKTKGDAKLAFDQLKTEMRAGRYNPIGLALLTPVADSTQITTFRQLATQYESLYVTARRLRTSEQFKYRLKPLMEEFADEDITAITSDRIERWQATLRHPRVFPGETYPRLPSTASVNRPVSLLRSILGWAVEHDRLGGKPKVRLDQEDYSRFRRVGGGEEESLLGAAPDRLKALIVVALDTGMRQGEMLALRCGDILSDSICLRGVTTKSAKTRVLPIATARLRAILDWLKDNKDDTAPLITSEDGTAGLLSFRRMWDSCRLRAHGFEPELTETLNLGPISRSQLRQIDLHWHDLRHEFACRLDDRGVSLGVIQRLLGHASIVTTERYLRRGNKELMAGAVKLDDGSLIGVDLAIRTPKDVEAVCLKVSQWYEPRTDLPEGDPFVSSSGATTY